MIVGDELNYNIRDWTASNPQAFPIANDGFLNIHNLYIIWNNFIMYENAFSLNYDVDWFCSGSLIDRENEIVPGLKTLHAGLWYTYWIKKMLKCNVLRWQILLH